MANISTRAKALLNRARRLSRPEAIDAPLEDADLEPSILLIDLDTTARLVNLPNHSSVDVGSRLLNVNLGAFTYVGASARIKIADIGSRCNIGYHVTINGSADNRIQIPEGVNLRDGAWISEAMPFVQYKKLSDNQVDSYAYAYRDEESGGFRVIAVSGALRDNSDIFFAEDEFELAAFNTGANLGLELNIS